MPIGERFKGAGWGIWIIVIFEAEIWVVDGRRMY